MPSTQRIEEALEDLNTQELPCFSATAKKYDYWPSTLRRRFYDKIHSREEVNDIYYSALTRAQEAALVGLINKLTTRGLPPTPRVVRNLAEEIRGSIISKN